MGNKRYPILGLGRRPDGANNCGLYYVGKDNISNIHGMPSDILKIQLYFQDLC